MKQGITRYIPDLLKFCVSIGLTLFCYWLDNNHIMAIVISSNNLPDALAGILTFATLILGFIGVLLPAIMSMKKESKLIAGFMKKISSESFSAYVRNNIISGILLNMCTVAMFFANDLMQNGLIAVSFAIGWCTFFFGIYFTITTFCVLNLLLRLMIEEVKGSAYPNG